MGGKASRKIDHPLYKLWESMRLRCSNPNATGYHNYGGRGISIDSSWDDFWIFVKDVGDRPKGTTLDRKDNNGPYSKNNCRWATRRQQMRNSKTVTIIDYGGIKRPLANVAEELGISRNRLRTLLKPKKVTLAQTAREIGLSESGLRNRMRRNNLILEEAKNGTKKQK